MTKPSDDLVNYASNYQRGGQGLEALLPLIDEVKELEQLCRDMSLCAPVPEGWDRHLFYDRMTDLGLLDGEQND